MFKWEYISPYVPIFWTKRLVRLRDNSIKSRIRKKRAQLRLKHKPPLFYVKDMVKARRMPFRPHHPQRRNYNTVYGRMQIPV